jgi:hypothetical protein
VARRPGCAEATEEFATQPDSRAVPSPPWRPPRCRLSPGYRRTVDRTFGRSSESNDRRPPSAWRWRDMGSTRTAVSWAGSRLLD